MALRLEDLRVLEAAEAMADDVWRQVTRRDPFARQVVGGQLARAADKELHRLQTVPIPDTQ